MPDLRNIPSTINLLARNLAKIMQNFVAPGGQLAVMIGDKLYRRNIGWAINQTLRVTDNHVFRIASNSKPITAIAMMKLYEEGKLDLDDHPYCDPNILGCNIYCDKPGILARTLPMPPGVSISPKQCVVTNRDELLMSAGFCEHDPLPNTPCENLPIIDRMDNEASEEALNAFGLNISSANTPPASNTQKISLIASQSTQYGPHTSYNYCNSCYDVIAEIISATTNLTYEGYVNSLFERYNIQELRIGSDLFLFPNEVVYYPQNTTLVPSIYPPLSADHLANPAYGGQFTVPNRPGDAGWVMSAADIVKVNYAMGEAPTSFHAGRRGVLKPDTIKLMLERPNISVWNSTNYWFGMGFKVEEFNGTSFISKDGQLPGSFSQMVNCASSENSPQIILAFVANSDMSSCTDCTDYVVDLFKQTILSIRYNISMHPMPLPSAQDSDSYSFLTGGGHATDRFKTSQYAKSSVNFNHKLTMPLSALALGSSLAATLNSTTANQHSDVSRSYQSPMQFPLLLLAMSTMALFIVIMLLNLILRKSSQDKTSHYSNSIKFFKDDVDPQYCAEKPSQPKIERSLTYIN